MKVEQKLFSGGPSSSRRMNNLVRGDSIQEGDIDYDEMT